MKIHHIAVFCRNAGLLSEFYIKFLEFKLIVTHLNEDTTVRSIWLQLSDQSILMLENNVNEFFSGGVIAFEIKINDRVRWTQRLRNYGISIEHETRYSVYFRDPENNRLAMTHYPFIHDI